MKNFQNDIELVEKLRKGDVKAFDLIYKKYSKKLYLFGMKYLGSSVETEELIQSVFLKLWENRRDLLKEPSFKSFLFTITYNDICKLFRRRKHHKKYINEVLNVNSYLTDQIDEIIDYQAILNEIDQLMEKLRPIQKTIFIKSRLEGKSTKEIAKELNLSPGTVDNYISKTIKFLRGRLRKYDLDL